MLEAVCAKCGETFIPHSEEVDDLIHGVTEAGDPCSGMGVVQGEWVITKRYPPIVGVTVSETRPPASWGCDTIEPHRAIYINDRD